MDSIKEYIAKETQGLKERQAKAQEELLEKQKQAQALRDTLLIMSGAMQTLEHIANQLQQASS